MDAYPSHAGWLAARGARVGGSDVAAILGSSPWAGPWDVWARLVRGRTPPVRDAGVLATGAALEGAVLELTSQRLRPTSRVEGHLGGEGPAPWAWCSPDGLWAVDGLNVGVEAKTSRDLGVWGADGSAIERWTDDAATVVPDYYLTQVYWYLHCTGLQRWFVAVLGPFFDLRVYCVERDERTQAQLWAHVSAWYQTHVVDGVEPDPSTEDEARAAAALRLVSPRRPPMHADAALSATIRDYLDARDMEATGERRRQAAARAILTAGLDERQIVTLDGTKVTIVRPDRRPAYLKVA